MKPPRALLRAFLTGCLAAALVAAAGPASAADPTRDVTYRGYHLPVPRDWPVIDLAAHPTTCVRFDRHAVYLGRPGSRQSCPARPVGSTEAVVVQPLDAAATAGIRDLRVLGPGKAAPDRLTGTVGHLVHLAVPAAGVLVTAGYDQLSVLAPVLRGAHLDRTARPAAVPRATPAAVPAAIDASATNYTGVGFDACNAPSSAVMSGWLSGSSYRAIGIYFGGAKRACKAQPNLTPSWLSTQEDNGWHFLPIYVGTQADGLGSSAADKGRAEADDAVSAAGALGIPAGSVLYNDMEAYSSTYTSRVLAYLNAWTAELHVKGYKSGVYSSGASGVKDLNAHYGASSPDVIWFAAWDDNKSTDTGYISSNHWTEHQRAHQYHGPVYETHGGYRMQIDRDYLDVQVAGTPNHPPTPDWPLVRNGDTGTRVKTIQYLLNQRRGAGLDVDGIFGPATTSAVKSFQSANGLDNDGIVGPLTWAKLVVTVQSGSTGDAVRAVQGELTAHGLPTPVTGTFDAATQTSVTQLQTSLDRDPDGVVDAEIWRFLVA